jgi:hypothetical protein
MASAEPTPSATAPAPMTRASPLRWVAAYLARERRLPCPGSAAGPVAVPPPTGADRDGQQREVLVVANIRRARQRAAAWRTGGLLIDSASPAGASRDSHQPRPFRNRLARPDRLAGHARGGAGNPAPTAAISRHTQR